MTIITITISIAAILICLCIWHDARWKQAELRDKIKMLAEINRNILKSNSSLEARLHILLHDREIQQVLYKNTKLATEYKSIR